MRTFYTIIKTKVDSSWKMVGWTENPYIAISYFREYKQMDKSAQMFTMECDTVMELYRGVKLEYGISVEDFISSRFTTKTSRDDRCYVIYKERYAELFRDDFVSKNSIPNICNVVSAVFIGLVPLLKYITVESEPDTNDLLGTVVFNAFVHTSNKQAISRMNGIITDIDVVYFWKFTNAMTARYGDMITADSILLRPYDAVFIDSN